MNYVLQILQFSVGGDFWRFLGCWILIGTATAGIGQALSFIATLVASARRRLD